jgi:hypothetical protein
MSASFFISPFPAAEIGQVEVEDCLVQAAARCLDEAQRLAKVGLGLLRIAAGAQDKAQRRQCLALKLRIDRWAGALQGGLSLPPRLAPVAIVQRQASQALVQLKAQKALLDLFGYHPGFLITTASRDTVSLLEVQVAQEIEGVAAPGGILVGIGQVQQPLQHAARCVELAAHQVGLAQGDEGKTDAVAVQTLQDAQTHLLGFDGFLQQALGQVGGGHVVQQHRFALAVAQAAEQLERTEIVLLPLTWISRIGIASCQDIVDGGQFRIVFRVRRRVARRHGFWLARQSGQRSMAEVDSFDITVLPEVHPCLPA